MTLIKNILVPTDFSASAQNALIYAIALAKKTGAKISILHIYSVPVEAYDTPIAYENAYESETLKSIGESLDQLKSDFFYSPKLSYEFITQQGNVEHEIEEIIHQKQIDLMVMGSRGAGKLRKIIGSSTLHMINRKICPMLVVPEKAKYKKLKKITYACDFCKTGDKSKFDILIALAELFNAEIDIINANKDTGIQKAHKEVAQEMLESVFNNISHHYYLISGQNIKDSINQHVLRHGTDLLVLLHRDHHLFEKIFQGSFTKKMALHTKIPLLVLHE